VGTIIEKLKAQNQLKKADSAPEIKPRDIPGGLFIACDKCHGAIYQKVLDDNLRVCPNCQHHFRLSAKERITVTLDENSFIEIDEGMTSLNPLEMPEYDEKLKKSSQLLNMNEAFVSGTGTIGSIPLAFGVLDPFFMMGSMGSVVGEKITRLVELSISEKLPLIIVAASGGARMQEGIYSLMQMAKTSAAIKRHSDNGLLYISVITDPTTGGVAASFASLGDILIAEPGALIGFAGPRVIKQTIQQDLPEGFQTSSFQLEHGQVDIVAKRAQIRPLLIKLLQLHGYGAHQ
jgi:acetyl-CoA carboxylase carboxyl transferase subunit beta